MKVSLAPPPSFTALKAPGTIKTGKALLADEGPKVILGWDAEDFATSVKPSPSSLFGPRGVCLHPDGSLWVADTGHHRLLGWRKVPSRDNAGADILIGQPDFVSEGRNAHADANAHSMNVPTGICAHKGGIAVADAWNHRVLIWLRPPTNANQPADIVLGQQDFSATLANEGRDSPTARTLHWPYGVASIGDALFVCDTGNRRLLIWRDVRETGQAADLVLGQHDFETRDENAGGDVSNMSMRWPHQIALWQGHIAVADAGNNRIMLWDWMPIRNGAPCDIVLGQESFSACDHNMANYYPCDRALNMPYALATLGHHLIVGDTANSRLLSYSTPEMGAAADHLTGQPDFAAKGDNRWGVAERDSLCWPYGLSVLGNTVAIADSGNNRILLWEAAV